MKATFKFVDPGALEATVTATMTLAGWRKVEEALSAASWSRPTGTLLEAIRNVIVQAEQTFICEPEDKP